MSRTAPPGTRTTPSPGSATGPFSVRARACTTVSSAPGTATRSRPGPSRNTAGITCSLAGSAVGLASSAPRPVAPSIQLSSSTALSTPPVATTCTTGVFSGPTRASTNRLARPRGGTEMLRPLVDGRSPVPPRTVTSAETVLAPGFVSTTRSRRVLPPPPATSQRSAFAAAHGAATPARSSPSVETVVCRAASPGASDPVAVTRPTLAPVRAPTTRVPRLSLWPRAVPAGTDARDTLP